MPKQYVLTELVESKKILNELNAIKSKLSALSMIGQSKYASKSILTNDEVLDLIGVSRGTLQNYRNKGLLSYSKINGTILYQFSDIIDFLEKHKYNSFS